LILNCDLEYMKLSTPWQRHWLSWRWCPL